MRQKAPAKDRRSPLRNAAAADQYSLFAASVAGQHDAHYFRRQAALCERLRGAVHQTDLCDRLASLQAEFEAAAETCKS